MEISIVKLKKVVDSLLAWVRQDLANNQATPAFSWLYRTFYDVTIDDTNFYEQLYFMLSLSQEDNRRLETRLMFDRERAKFPTFHIHYPSEDGKSGDNTLNTGYLRTEIVYDERVNVFSRSFIGQYDLIVTAGNSLEVIMLYEFIDALLIAGADTMSYNFDRFEFSGKQLMTNQEIIPYLTFYRAVSLSIQAKKEVHSLTTRKIAHDIAFVPHFYTDSQEPGAPVVSVSIVASALTGNVGDSITFTATSVYGGDNPVYEWYLDDVLIDNSNLVSITLPLTVIGTFTIACHVYSELQYLVPNIAVSNIITIQVT